MLTLAAVMELLENPATDLTRIADVDGKAGRQTMIQIEQELQRIKDTYFSGREFTGGTARLMEHGAAGHQLAVFASAKSLRALRRWI